MVRSQWMSFYYYYLRVLGRSALVRHLQEKEQMLPLWECSRINNVSTLTAITCSVRRKAN